MGGKYDDPTFAPSDRRSLGGRQAKQPRRMLVGCAALVMSISLVGACGSSGKRTADKREGANPTRTTAPAGPGDPAGRDRGSDTGHAGTDGGTSNLGAATTGDATPGARSGAAAGGAGAGDDARDDASRSSRSSAVLGSARASVQDVVLLHNLAVGLGRANGLPGDVTLTQSARLEDEFRGAQRSMEALEQYDKDAATLATVQGDYADLAHRLHGAAGSPDKTLPARFSEDLDAADKRWRSALTVIGRTGGVDLLKNVPPLLMPQQPDTTIPPPPK